MSEIPFWKCQSAGNDFVLVHLDDLPSQISLPKLSQRASDRHRGIGSDGLLVVQPHREGLVLRMFNPDGSEDFCGNGLRIAAQHAARQGWVPTSFRIHHLGKVVKATISEDGSVRTELDAASFAPKDVPVLSNTELFQSPFELNGQRLIISAVSTGSTHTVILVDRLPEDRFFESVSKALELHPMFPERTSVIWTEPASERELRIRIWERGAGETLGCGTGSSAAAVVWFRMNDLSGKVTVMNPGGPIELELSNWQGPIVATSTPVEVYQGSFRIEDLMGTWPPQNGASR